MVLGKFKTKDMKIKLYLLWEFILLFIGCMSMKKNLCIFLMFFIFSNFLCAEKADTVTIDGLRKHLDYQYKEIESVGMIKNLSLFVLVDQEDWFERAVLYNSKTGELTELKDIDEQAIFSTKIIKTDRKEFFEVVGLTHMGHGNVYLYDSDGKLFLNIHT